MVALNKSKQIKLKNQLKCKRSLQKQLLNDEIDSTFLNNPSTHGIIFSKFFEDIAMVMKDFGGNSSK